MTVDVGGMELSGMMTGSCDELLKMAKQSNTFDGLIATDATQLWGLHEHARKAISMELVDGVDACNTASNGFGRGSDEA